MPSAHEHSVVLYTRRGCHLCDDVKLVLGQFGLVPREVDIDSQPDAELKSRYDHWVPVVEINGKERFRGGVDPTLLRRILQSESATG
ncbi:MAG: glutaredoxin family protein [Planctomycetia bacterium]|nr:glutaredoxin family protein [Planctomycetia bacterium]